jgi:hypothetical protein
MEAHQMTAVAPVGARFTEDWVTDTTTTMGEQPGFVLDTRTTEPSQSDAAWVRAVCSLGNEWKPFAWSRVPALGAGTRITDKYDFTVDLADNEDAVLGKVERISSSSAGRAESCLFVVPSAMGEPTPAPRTALGKRLMELRRKIIASGQPLLDWSGLERELRARRARELPGDDG